jgi:hypothetical protein
VTSSSRPFATSLLALATCLSPHTDAIAQIGAGAAVGQFYLVEPPSAATRYFDAVRIERVAPHAMVMPAPFEPIRLGPQLQALTGQILEVPDRQRIYFTAVDGGGAIRVFEIDLMRREARQIAPPASSVPPYAARMLTAPDASKLYIQWFRYGSAIDTDIYDGQSLRWIGSTRDFRPDERAAGFEHRAPYMWTLDTANRPVLVDTSRDAVVRVFDYQRVFGPVLGVVGDIWRDLILVRLDAGHDRYHVVDALSGEVGPPLDLDGYRLALPRLVMDGRFLALIDMERRPPGRSRWAETAIATGVGVLYDLRDGRQLEEFRFFAPHELPVSAVGTTADQTIPGRLWIHVPSDDARFDLDLPACGQRTRNGGELDAVIEARWDPSGESHRYAYRARVAPSSQAAAGAIAVRAGRETDRTGVPDGWGVDLIERDRWVRWTNGLGPSTEDVAPGTALAGFVVEAHSDTRPGIAEYRIQAAIGLPRGCESEDRFLENSLGGHTIAPERVDTDDPHELAERLQELVQRACEIGWVEQGSCGSLESAAAAVESASTGRAGAVERFVQELAAARTETNGAVLLRDAAAAVREAIEPPQ